MAHCQLTAADDLTVLEGGPYCGMWFTTPDWRARQEATRLVRTECDPPDAGASLRYAETGRRVQHCDQCDATGSVESCR